MNKDQIVLEGIYMEMAYGLSGTGEAITKKELSLRKIAIENLLPDKDNMEVAVDSLHKGRYSSDKNPITAYKDKGKYIVADGHHRLLQAIINGEASMNVKILPSDPQISRKGTIKLDFYDGDYYGLDSSLENGWLINRL